MAEIRTHLKLVMGISILVLILSGCWDRQEIEERTSVVALALDKSKSHPEMLRLSVQIPIPKKIAGSGTSQGGGGGGREAVRVMSATGYTLSEASRNLQKRLNQELFYGHTRIIAVSEEVAREGMDTMVDAIRRTPQMRRLLWPVVVKGEARKLLETNPKLEQIPILFLLDLLNTNAKMGYIPDVSLGDFFINLSDSTREPGMNIIEATPDEVKWIGLAIFQGSKMIDQLTPEEVFTLLQVRDEKIGGTFSVSCKGENQVSFRPKSIKTDKKFDFKQGRVHIRINVRLEGDIVESQCNIDYSKQKNIHQIERKLEMNLEQRANQFFHRLQQNMKQDVTAFGKDIRALYPERWKPDKWKDQFSQAEIETHYTVLVRRTGMEMK